MCSRTHALLWWPEDGQGTVVAVAVIKEPRKPFEVYQKGDVVKGCCTGFLGCTGPSSFNLVGSYLQSSMLFLLANSPDQEMYLPLGYNNYI